MASRLETYLRRVIAPADPLPGAGPSALRAFLAGAAGLYDAGLGAYLTAERLGLRRRTTLPIPVVSIGNLSVGGTGKTPMTQWLCRRLSADGRRVAVLSRGHGGRSQAVRIVSDQAGEVSLPADEAGDEPALLARTLPGTPVLVGKDRRLSGREALRCFGLDALVLDDGFQYWQLARDLDIVLLDARLPFDNGYPLPRGLLREPKRHLSRAGVVVVTRADSLSPAGREALRAQITRLAPRAEIFFACHAPAGLVLPAGTAPTPVSAETLRGRRVLAVSAIAQPESFIKTLIQATGAQIVEHRAYEDHARFTEGDAAEVWALAAQCRAEAIVMTEKDAVKWPPSDSPTPVYALRIEMQVEDEARFLAAVAERLFRSAPPS